MRKAVAGLALLSAASFGGVAERVVDPFDRHDNDHTIEGPASHSEVFYMSVNTYDGNGEKHDDRAGDAMIAAGALAITGAIVIGSRGESAEN